MAKLERLPSHILIQLEPEDRKLELGRQTREEPPPLVAIPKPGLLRLVIANREEVLIGRDQLRIEVIDPQHVRLTNINENNQVAVPGEGTLGPLESLEVSLPVLISRGTFQLRIESSDPIDMYSDDDAFESMAAPPRFPNSVYMRQSTIQTSDSDDSSIVHSIRNSNTKAMLDRLENLVSVLQQAASSTNFDDQIAQASLDMVNLDRASVMTHSEGRWLMVGRAEKRGLETEEGWSPSQMLLNEMLRIKHTIWGAPRHATVSTTSITSLVAAPILNPLGQIIGAVYGDRQIELGSSRPAIDELDAKLVEIMACGVAGGWARMEQERSAAARRVQFERFVTKEVAQELEEHPNALKGRDATVTMLFCDIAGFSRISREMPTDKVFEWINAVMEALSKCVLATKGTLVDYIGDELIAMWGAPLTTEDHATAAAQTAIMMLESLADLNQRYRLPGGEMTQIGIGLNSGQVRVGNTGSEHKLKYGPLGNEVNVASRVQGATRYLRTPALMTGATARLLGDRFPTRRLCKVRLKNIDEPIELYELTSNQGPGWSHIVENYERALKAWEERKLQTAIESLSNIVAKLSQDGPSMVLLSRAVDVWSRDLHDYDPVWTLPSK